MSIKPTLRLFHSDRLTSGTESAPGSNGESDYLVPCSWQCQMEKEMTNKECGCELQPHDPTEFKRYKCKWHGEATTELAEAESEEKTFISATIATFLTPT